MPNNRFNLINPLSRFVLLATLVYAQTAPSPSGTDLKVKRMLARDPAGDGKIKKIFLTIRTNRRTIDTGGIYVCINC